MPGPNTTGTANTDDYNLGRGIVYAAVLTNKLPGPYRDLGNAPEFNISIEKETQEHQSSRQGLRVTDKEVVLTQSISVSFQLDEINHENLADFFSGEKSTYTNVSVAGFTEHEMVPEGTLEAGRWYDITDSSRAANGRAYDVTGTDLTVNTTNASPVTLVEDTDYTIDTEFGRIFLLSTSAAVTTAVSAGEGLDVTLAAAAGASAVNEVRALTKSAVTVALKFLSVNPASNDNRTEYQFHQIALSADGDLSLIGDEFSVMPFSGTAERNETASSTSPTLTVRDVAA